MELTIYTRFEPCANCSITLKEVEADFKNLYVIYDELLLMLDENRLKDIFQGESLLKAEEFIYKKMEEARRRYKSKQKAGV